MTSDVSIGRSDNHRNDRAGEPLPASDDLRSEQGTPGSLVRRGLRLLRRDDEGRPSLRERLVPPMPAERWWVGWGGPVLVAAIAGAMRFHNLGQPDAVVFDETYYAKDAWTLWEYGYEHNWQPPKVADPALLHHHIMLAPGPEYTVHPPAGKWLIGLGEHLFGMTPFGWRFTVALLGTLAVLMLARIARRMTRSTLLGSAAGLLMAFDGLEFVMSRTALLDLIAMFWILAAFGALVVDRDKVRERVVDWREALPPGQLSPRQRGPRLGWRPWRIAAGVCLGLAAASKWNGIFALVVFAIMSLLWDRGARRAAGIRQPSWATVRRDVVPTAVSLVLVSLGVYLASWAGWFATSGGYFRQWATTNRPSSWLASILPGPIRSLWHYEYVVYQFNANLHAYHPYKSNPWSWLVMGRPVSFYYESPTFGQSGCKANQCSQAVLALGTPTLWWVGTACLVYMVWRWALRRDWRAGGVLAGMAACWLPWLHYASRTIFEFYAVTFAPYLVLAVTLTLGALLGRPDASPTRRMWGTVAAGTIVLSVVAAFIYFYPIYTGQTIPYSEWQSRMWFESWI